MLVSVFSRYRLRKRRSIGRRLTINKLTEWEWNHVRESGQVLTFSLGNWPRKESPNKELKATPNRASSKLVNSAPSPCAVGHALALPLGL